MTALGITLLVIGVVMVVAEAHAPSGALGVGGGIALIVGGIIAIASVGGSAAIAVPVGIVLGLGSGGLDAARQARGGERARAGAIRAGTEALNGRIGEVRSWSGDHGTRLRRRLSVARMQSRTRLDERPIEAGRPRDG